MGPKGKKNQIQYIKPNEPAFLKRLKAAAGYKEGPNVDTKVQIKILWSKIYWVSNYTW